MRGVLQHDENDCGLACIFTICKYLHIKVDEKELRKNIFLGNEGLSLYGITEMFNSIGIKSLAVECNNTELFTLLAQKKCPILVMIKEDNECHYVVLYKNWTKKVYLWDPNKGKRVVTKDYFDLIWSGYAVYITELLKCEKNAVPSHSICWSTLLQHKRCLFFLILFSVMLIGASISATFIYKIIIEQIELGIHVFTPQLIQLFLLMGVCYSFITILFIVKGLLIAYVKNELGVTLQQKFVKSMLNMSVQKKEDYTSGGFLDRFNRLSVIVETMSSVFTMVLVECVSLLAGIILLMNINVSMFCMVLIIVFSYIVSFILSKKKLYELSKTIMDKESLLLTHIKETIENLITLKNVENSKYINKIEKEIYFVKKQRYVLNKISISMKGILSTIENFVMLLVLIYGINSVINNNMSLGTLLVFESFVGLFLSPIKNLLSILPSLQETILTFNRIEDIFINKKSSKFIEYHANVKGKVSVNNLDVAYGFDKPILRKVSFNIESGENIFLVGASGCGKSTLAKILAGIVQYRNGNIVWDNDIDADKIDLSKQILYLSQDAEIFSGSIKDNILMWEENYDQTLFDEVLEAVGVYQIINTRGLTLDNHLLENGTNLSGGEKQRIALARAIMKNSPVYIFDEATCHLDSDSEEKILKYIKGKLLKNTCIFISHNVCLLNDYDKVIFIDSAGKLHTDTHLQMSKNNVEYMQMFKMK